jgi:excisionase family DNA binding protein
MPTTKNRRKRTNAPAPPASEFAANGEVLTLAEAAAYLRVSEDEILRLVGHEGLPGRRLGSEWRFLKSALQNWLATPSLPSSKEALLAMAGKYKDDPFLDKIVSETDRQRGRPSAAEGGCTSSTPTPWRFS